jgi:hypothetical protein
MATISDYFLKLLENCSEEQTGQDAVAWAIFTGRIKLTYDLQTDLTVIMGGPVPQADGSSVTLAGKYDEIIEGYQRVCQEHGGALVNLYESSGLLEEILRPVSLAQQNPETLSA